MKRKTILEGETESHRGKYRCTNPGCNTHRFLERDEAYQGCFSCWYTECELVEEKKQDTERSEDDP